MERLTDEYIRNCPAMMDTIDRNYHILSECGYDDSPLTEQLAIASDYERFMERD